MFFVVTNDERTHEFFILDVISEVFVTVTLDVWLLEFLLDLVKFDIFEVFVNDIDGFRHAFLSTVSFFQFLDDLSETLDSVRCAFLDFYDFCFKKVVVFLKEILNLLSFLGVDNQGNCKVVQTLLDNGFVVWINLDLEIKEFQSLCILWKGVSLAIKLDFGAFDKLHFGDFFLWNDF